MTRTTERDTYPAWHEAEPLHDVREVLAYYGELIKTEGSKLRNTAKLHLRNYGVRFVRDEDGWEVIHDAIVHLAGKAVHGTKTIHRHPGLLYRQLEYSAKKRARKIHTDREKIWQPNPSHTGPAEEQLPPTSPPEQVRLAPILHSLHHEAVKRIRAACVPEHGGSGLTEGRWNAFIQTELHRAAIGVAEPPTNSTHQNARRARNAIAPILVSLMSDRLNRWLEAPVDSARWGPHDLSEIAAALGLTRLNWGDLAARTSLAELDSRQGEFGE